MLGGPGVVHDKARLPGRAVCKVGSGAVRACGAPCLASFAVCKVGCYATTACASRQPVLPVKFNGWQSLCWAFRNDREGYSSASPAIRARAVQVSRAVPLCTETSTRRDCSGAVSS